MFLKAKKKVLSKYKSPRFFVSVPYSIKILVYFFFFFPPLCQEIFYSAVSLKTKTEYNCFELACVAGVRKGKGRELERETTRAQIPLPLPLLTPATQASFECTYLIQYRTLPMGLFLNFTIRSVRLLQCP